MRDLCHRISGTLPDQAFKMMLKHLDVLSQKAHSKTSSAGAKHRSSNQFSSAREACLKFAVEFKLPTHVLQDMRPSSPSRASRLPHVEQGPDRQQHVDCHGDCLDIDLDKILLVDCVSKLPAARHLLLQQER